MKKLILALSLAILSVATVNAQSSIFNNPENKAYFGIRVGADITCPGNVKYESISFDMYNNGAGIEFGGIYNIPLLANLYVEPGVNLYYDTYSMKSEYVKMLQDDIIFDKITYKKFGIRVPVMVGYHFDFTKDLKVSVFTGPELEIGLSAKDCASGHNVNLSGNLYDYSFNRVNLLWGFGAGVSYSNYCFTVKGAPGLLNICKKESKAVFHESHVTFSIGYNF